MTSVQKRSHHLHLFGKVFSLKRYKAHSMYCHFNFGQGPVVLYVVCCFLCGGDDIIEIDLKRAV